MDVYGFHRDQLFDAQVPDAHAPVVQPAAGFDSSLQGFSDSPAFFLSPEGYR
jgi:hypothetical protein